MSTAPTIPYWHLWTDADGISRQTRCAMTEFDLKSIKPPADPQWQRCRASGRMTVLLTVLPVGWIGTWHENPKPQWIVPLSGRWFVESMDGTRVEMGPGELSFGGDQNCRRTDGKRVHRSGTVGDEPAALILIQPRMRPRSPRFASSDSAMNDFHIVDRRFAHYILENAPLEELAGGFRWIEGPVWIGDANCLLFQDLPRDRTMRWIEDAGISIYRSPSGYANGQARDRQGRLISCSHASAACFGQNGTDR